MKIWVIQASFDNELTAFLGSADAVVRDIEGWSTYRWEEMNVSNDYIWLDGYDISGENEIHVRYTAALVDITDQFARAVLDLFRDMSHEEKCSLAYVLPEDNSMADVAMYWKAKGKLIPNYPKPIENEVIL